MNPKKIIKIDKTEFTKKLKPVYVAIQKVKKEIKGKSLIGFVGALDITFIYVQLESPKEVLILIK